MKAFFIYIITNRSRVVLYIGITNSLERRASEHLRGEIKRLTEKYKLNRFVYERYNNPRPAIPRANEIKGWRRENKSALIETLNPRWSDLSPQLFEHLGGPSLRSR